MSPGVTVLNQIHRKSRRQNFNVNARESSGGEKRASMCVCVEGECVCVPIRPIFVSVWLSFDV